MSATASRGVGAVPAPQPVWLFVKTRAARTAVVGSIAVGVLTAWLGLVEARLPTAAEEGQAVIPLWRMLVIAAAVLPVLALSSPLASLEVTATHRLRRVQRYYIFSLATGSAVIYLSISALAIHFSLLAMIARASVAWFGLALLAGRLLGRRLAWTLPSIVAIVLWFWGYQKDGYPWWEFTALAVPRLAQPVYQRHAPRERPRQRTQRPHGAVTRSSPGSGHQRRAPRLRLSGHSPLNEARTVILNLSGGADTRQGLAPQPAPREGP